MSQQIAIYVPHQSIQTYNQPQSVVVPVAQTNRAIDEPHEAAVSRSLAIISLFCCCQLWFSIPALVFAYQNKKSKWHYEKSIVLSLTAISIGTCFGIGCILLFVYIFKY